MENYTKEDLAQAQKLISSTILNCEKMQLKFAQGTSSHTLLKNRIKALYISKALIIDEAHETSYTHAELTEAMNPILSIIHKCEKAQLKFEAGTAHYNRLQHIITAMSLSKSLLTDALSKSN